MLFGNTIVGLDVDDRGLRTERHGRRHHALATSFLIFDLVLVINHRNRVEHGLVALAGMRLVAYAGADRAFALVVIASLGGKINRSIHRNQRRTGLYLDGNAQLGTDGVALGFPRCRSLSV